MLIKTCSQKLDNISERTRKMEEFTVSGTEMIGTKLARIGTLQQEGSVSQELNWTRFGDQFLSFQKRLEIGLFQSNTVDTGSWSKDPRRRGKARLSVFAASVSWMTEFYSMPFGYFKIHISQGAESGCRISATFVPPRWLSNTMLQWILQTGGNQDKPLSGLQTSLDPFYVNQNPLLIHALWKDDLPALLQLFDAKLARPSDCIQWFIEPQSLTQVRSKIVTL